MINISWIFCFFNFFLILSLFLLNGLETLYVNSVCLKCISRINLCTANKYLIYFIPCVDLLNTVKTKKDLIKKFYLDMSLFLNWLINFVFLPSHTTHFDKSISLPFLAITSFGFLLSVFFIHFKQYNRIVLYIVWTFIYY